MEKKSNNLETVFQSAFKQHVETPSPKVLSRLKYRLWVSDFFSFKMNKPNVVYTTILAGAIIAGFLYFNGNPDASQTDKLLQPSTNETINESSDIIPSDKKANVDKQAINSNKELLAAYFDVTNIKGCAPLQVNFKALSDPSITYAWDFGNGKSSDKHNPSYTYSKPGTYIASLTISNNKGYTDTYSKEIQVFETPVAKAIIDIEKSDNADRKVAFINKSKGSNSHQWSFGDNYTTNIENPAHTYDEYGVYYVKLIASSDNGCRDTTEIKNLFVKNDYQLIFPYTFKPNTSDKGNNGYYESDGAQSAIFYPKNYGAKEYQLSIKTSNGIEVFTTNDIKQGWNGYVLGRIAPGGTYSYTAKGIYPNGESFHIDGKVKIIIEDYFQD